MVRLRSGARSDAGSAAPWLVLAVLLVVPLLALSGWWLVARGDNPTRAAAVEGPVVVPVTREDVRAQATVGIELVTTPGRDIAALGSGTVTQAVVPGTTLDQGAVALRVDDRPVRVMVSSAPPWRSLGPGDRGEDVARLQEMLAALGYRAGAADGRFGATLARAVAAFNVDAGLGPDVTSFDPATVLWVGPEALVAAESLAPVGTVLAPGTAVARGPSRPASVTVTEPEGGLGAAGAFGDAAVLAYGGASVPYAPGSGAVTAAADVAALAAALGPVPKAAAQVTAVQARPVAIVPASALVQGADGTICVYPAVDEAPLAVTPVGGGVGSSQLPADVALETVLANPGRAHPVTPCGS